MQKRSLEVASKLARKTNETRKKSGLIDENDDITAARKVSGRHRLSLTASLVLGADRSQSFSSRLSRHHHTHQISATIMESYVNNNGNQQRQGSCGVRSSSSSAPAAVGVTAACSEIECLSKNVPVFLDRTFKMIGQVPDDVVCWSTAGDSFIIKQVRARANRHHRCLDAICRKLCSLKY